MPDATTNLYLAQPGEVWKITWANRPLVEPNEKSTVVAVRGHDRWTFPGGSLSDVQTKQPEIRFSALRMVVVDPTDPYEVERLANAFEARRHADCGSGSCLLDQTRAALDDFLALSTIVEPTGKFAQVENSEGMTYYLSPAGNWHRESDDLVRPWSHIGATKVISDGWPS